MRKRSELLFSLAQVPVDAFALLGAFALAFLIRAKSEGHPLAYPIHGWDFLQLVALILPAWVVIFALSGLYSQTSLRSRWKEAGRIVVAVSGGVMLMILTDFFWVKPIFPSKAIPVYAYALGIVFVGLGRLIVNNIQRYMFRYGIGIRRTVVVGSGKAARRVIESLSNPYNGYRVDLIVDSAVADKTFRGIPVAGSFEEAVAKLGPKGIDEIINTCPITDQSKIDAMLNYATNHYISFRYAPSQFNLYTANSDLSSIGGVPMIEVRLTPLDGWGRILKRAFDVIGATLAVIIFSPVMVVVAAIIKITDPGPIIYRHERVSRAGGRFGVMKFRTMSWKYSTGPDRKYKTAEEAFGAMGREDLIEEFKRDQKVADDPRVGKFGRFLRRSSLDELPQFFNVLKGEMSLVGPRPVLPSELERYGEHGASFLSLKPGITGMWQVSGRNNVSYEDRIKLDVYYVENWSLWLDMVIIGKTALILISRKGAY